MERHPRQTSTCPDCGSALEETSGGGVCCMACLLRAGIDSEEKTAGHSTDGSAEGEHFGVYEIDRHDDGSLYELGRGAMGVSYRATDRTLQRKVALKIIKIDIAVRSSGARERFMREARAAARLRHENVATVYQFGIREKTGQYFYAMELIEGETLNERVHRVGPLDADATIQIGHQVSSALAAAEKQGLVHRDLKPANLMLVSFVDEADEDTSKKLLVKIIDFGLAKALYAETDLESLTHEKFVGTPAFASPEQFEHASLDIRSDIYSLGATLWFALTGKTPFAGRSVNEIHRAQQSNVLPINQLKAAHVPSRLRSLVKSMLALQPASRPSPKELTVRLQRCSREARGIQRSRLALAATAILTLGISAAFILLPIRTKDSHSSFGAPEKSIAVLPFENMSNDADNAYFTSGIQEEILTRLANIADLKVISRTSTLQYKSKPGNLAEIAKQLGVANILEGSVQKVGDQVRVNVQLINTQTDFHLWAESYDRNSTDILGVESEIAQRIAESLQAKLSGRERQALAVKPTNNPNAYDAYLRGLSFEARSAYSGDFLEKAISSYERAVQLDPEFALAWARLSRADANLYFRLGDTTAARRNAAKRALENAERLQPNSADAQLARGYYQFWVLRDYSSARTTFEIARKVLPGSSEILEALAAVTRREGIWEQSLAHFGEALALDPRNAELLKNMAWTYALLRRFGAALKFYDRALDIVPNDPDLLAVKAGIYQAEGNLKEADKILAAVNADSPSTLFESKITQLRLERNYDEAVRLLEVRQKGMRLDSEFSMLVHAQIQISLAFAQRLEGDIAGARITASQACNTLEQLKKRQPENSIFAGYLSSSYAALDERDLALGEAQRAVALLPSAKDRIYGPGLEENLARIQALCGENVPAISTLRRLLQTPYVSLILYNPLPITCALLRLDPIWDPLRADPAFQNLCEDKKL